MRLILKTRGVIRVDDRANVKLEGHGSAAQFAHALQFMTALEHFYLLVAVFGRTPPARGQGLRRLLFDGLSDG